MAARASSALRKDSLISRSSTVRNEKGSRGGGPPLKPRPKWAERLLLRHGQEDLLTLANDAHQRRATRGHTIQLTLRVSGGVDRDAADADDHVARAQTAPAGGAVLLDVGDHRAAFDLEAHASRELWCDVLDRDAEAARCRRLGRGVTRAR